MTRLSLIAQSIPQKHIGNKLHIFHYVIDGTIEISINVKDKISLCSVNDLQVVKYDFLSVLFLHNLVCKEIHFPTLLIIKMASNGIYCILASYVANYSPNFIAHCFCCF